MWQPEQRAIKIPILAGLIALTLGIHYGWLIEPIFGNAHWVHAIHGRFCYIPIVIAAVWFGMRGSVLVAAVISLLVLPYILGSGLDNHSLADEWTEIVYYFALAILSGALIDRELRARQRVEQARLEIERSQRLSLVGQIAAGMAHEIKNPLASIKGAVEILGDQTAGPEEKDEFREILFKEVRRVDRSLTDFLDFARPSETRPKPVDLEEIVADSIRQLEPQAQKDKLILTGRLESGLVINADREKIHQVMLNLLLNAMQASPPGSEIRVSLSTDRSTGEAVLTVEDNGSGLDKQSSERPFEPFYSTKTGGTGLGLTIARTIIEKHSGTIALQNRPGEAGAIATVRLPLETKG